jgi:DNA ligase-1
MDTLDRRVKRIENLFDTMNGENASSWQIGKVAEFKRTYPEMVTDLDFCFEVLAGKHKVGYTMFDATMGSVVTPPFNSIKEYYLRRFVTSDLSESNIGDICFQIPYNWRPFFIKLVNREYKLGYSNKKNMVNNLTPMLAKVYPEHVRAKKYYIQEKLDGNRCIAYYDYDEGKWKFQSRSGKPLNVDFDMNWADYARIYDGEIMRLSKAGSRDFAATSGLINAKYADKSQLHYFIYDILISNWPYYQRMNELAQYEKEGRTSDQCSIVPVLDLVEVDRYKGSLEADKYLDMIVSKGGEGIMLRDPDGVYQHGKRSNFLLKYKKVRTMDLRITDWNWGKGKYEGLIGSFVCESDDGQIKCNVAGISDDIRESEPELYVGMIVEIAYFDESKSAANDYTSLRFPRFVKFRNDKNETSTF